MSDTIGSLAGFVSGALLSSELGGAELLFGLAVGFGLMLFPVAELRGRATHLLPHKQHRS